MSISNVGIIRLRHYTIYFFSPSDSLLLSALSITALACKCTTSMLNVEESQA